MPRSGRDSRPRQAHVPPPEDLSRDPVARRTSWATITRVADASMSYGVVRAGRERWLLRLRDDAEGAVAAAVVIVLLVGAAAAHFGPLQVAIPAVLPLFVAFLLGLGFVQGSYFAVVDARERQVWRPRTGGGEPWSLGFEEIHALQVLVREDGSDVAELNVVRTDGRRLHVLTQGGGPRVVQDARRLAAQLDVPVWVAPVPPLKVLTLSEITARKRSEALQQRVRHRESARGYVLSVPGALMLLANVGPLVEVLLGGWTALDVLTLYWWEIVVVGVFSVLRLDALPSGAWKTVKRLSILFFTVHYGGLAALQGWVVLSLGREASVDGGAFDLGPLMDAPTDPGIGIWILLFAVSQGVSFFRDYLGRREYVRADPSKLLTAPYARIAMLHGALIPAITAAPLVVDAPAIALATLVVMMVAADILGRVLETAELPRGAVDPPSSS